MKVIFIKDLRGQGKRGDIKEVKDGYAKNYLIKNGYASQLTDSTLGKYNRECEELKQQDKKMREEANNIKKKIENVELVFNVKTGKNDQVFGSISAKQVKDELQNNGIEIDKKQVEFDHTISSLGYHDVKINLYKDVFAKVKVKLEK